MNTKLESYLKTDRQSKRQEMLQFFKERPGLKFSRRHLEHNLKWRSGPICARVNELLASGDLEVAGTTYDYTTQRNVELLRLKKH